VIDRRKSLLIAVAPPSNVERPYTCKFNESPELMANNHCLTLRVSDADVCTAELGDECLVTWRGDRRRQSWRQRPKTDDIK